MALIDRRRALFFIAAPAIVRAASLMPVSAKLLLPKKEIVKAAFAGSFSGTTLTVGAISMGNIHIGAKLSGCGIPDDMLVTAQICGVPGGLGTYTVSEEQNVASSTITVVA